MINTTVYACRVYGLLRPCQEEEFCYSSGLQLRGAAPSGKTFTHKFAFAGPNRNYEPLLQYCALPDDLGLIVVTLRTGETRTEEEAGAAW